MPQTTYFEKLAFCTGGNLKRQWNWFKFTLATLTIAAVRGLCTRDFAKIVIMCKFFKITKFGVKFNFSYERIQVL